MHHTPFGDFCKKTGTLVMPMKMGIHHKLIGQGHSAFLDSPIRGNDGGSALS